MTRQPMIVVHKKFNIRGPAKADLARYLMSEENERRKLKRGSVTPCTMTLSILTFRIPTFSKLPFNIPTFSIMTFTIMTLSIMTITISQKIRHSA
jgi:hypothetical protein